MKNFTYSSMNFDLLSAERDKRDFRLSVFELRQERELSTVEPAAFTLITLWYAKGNNTLYKTQMRQLQ